MKEVFYNIARSETGRILQQVRVGRVEPSVAELAESLGLSQSKALREVDRLVEAGLLAERRSGRQRLLRLDVASPFYPALAELLFLAYGDPPAAPDSPQGGRRDTTLPDELSRFAADIPQELHPIVALQQAPTKDIFGGPDLVTARAAASRLHVASEPCRGLERVLRDAYNEWHEERDRDLIHQVGRSGDGVVRATGILRTATHVAQQRGQKQVGVAAWAASIFCVAAARTSLHQDVVEWCAASATLGATLRRTRRLLEKDARLLEGLTDDARLDDSERRRHHLEDSLETHKREHDDALRALEPYHWVGGMPLVDDVGTAGERLIASRLREVTAALDDELATMTADAGFAPWRNAFGRIMHHQRS